MEIQKNILKPGTRVLLMDDLLATGGTLGAAQQFCVELGFELVETLVIIELNDLGGRKKLTSADRCTSLLQFSDADIEAMAAKNGDQAQTL